MCIRDSSYAACSQHAPNEHILADLTRESLQIMAGEPVGGHARAFITAGPSSARSQNMPAMI